MKLQTLNKRKDTDMTVGSIPRLLLYFSVPLLIGNVFQQLYNTVDSIIVGNYVGKEALAAIGCSTPVINTFIMFFSGLASGAGVLISNNYGARNDEKLHQSVQTTLSFTLILCVLITFLGVWLTPKMLVMMDTPDDVMDEAAEYLRIYFMGVSGLLLYNIGSGILRAVGDSTRPLYVLIFCTVLNTALDILFVKTFGMGVSGAAVATVIAMVLSAMILLIMLQTTDAPYRMNVFRPELKWDILKGICAIGLPSAIQMALTSFSNVFVQSYINRFGSSAMAGWSAYLKVDAFAMLPIASLSLALTTFVGQNIGAKDIERTKKSMRVSIGIGYAMMAVLIVPLMLFAPQLTMMFNREASVVEMGTFFIRWLTPFYLFFVINQMFRGFLTGCGKTMATMIIMLTSFVAVRQIYLFIVYRLGGSLLPIALGYPLGWFACSVLLLIYYFAKKPLDEMVTEE